MMKKKGISGIVSVVIIIALVMAAGLLVWNFVQDTLSERMEETQSCYNARGKVEINEDYTCYNVTEEELKISISVGDINLDGLLISVLGDTGSETYKLTSEARNMTNIKNYPSGKGTVIVPGRESGRVFVLKGLEEMDLNSMTIEISPIMGENQCDPLDSIKKVYPCSVFN